MDALCIGIIAGILTSTSLVPQLVKILREKKAEAISIGMLLILLAGFAGWIWYGIEKLKPKENMIGLDFNEDGTIKKIMMTSEGVQAV
jgi:uncharacterized protein with PQ loop repeat